MSFRKPTQSRMEKSNSLRSKSMVIIIDTNSKMVYRAAHMHKKHLKNHVLMHCTQKKH